MSKEHHRPVGKRALVGAILDRHIDPQISLLSSPQVALAGEGSGEVPLFLASTTASMPIEQPVIPSDSVEKTPKSSKKQDTHHKSALNQQSKLALFVALAMLLIAVPLTAAFSFYSQRALPGLSIAGTSVSSKNRQEVTELVNANISKVSLTVVSGDKTWTPSLKDVGMSVDVESTVDAAMTAGRDEGPLRRLAWWRKTDVPIQVSIDDSTVVAYEQSIVQETSTQPVNATIAYKDGAYVVTPSALGESTGIQSSLDKLKSGLDNFGPITLTVAKQSVEPKVTESDLKDTVGAANTLLSVPVTLSYQGKTYQPSKDQISGWIVTNSDPEKLPYSVGLDNAKVAGYVESIAKTLAIASVDKLVTKNQDQGGQEQVLREGKNGRQVKDKQSVTNALIGALNNRQPFVRELETEEIAFKVESSNSYDRYIDVDISAMKLIAYEKGVEIKSFAISTGDAYHKTPPGEYTIYRKTRSQTMYGGSKTAGDYFYLPNVEYISWFYGEYSIHGAYWHNLFGVRNTSHGCVNMRNADAGWVYEWAPVGTKVVIHA